MKPEVSRAASYTRAPVKVWVGLRLASFAVAIVALYLDPRTRNRSTLWAWLLSPWEAYDTSYYRAIVETGYRAGDPVTNFHPLFPWTATLFNLIVHNSLLSLLIVSSIAGALFTIVFYKFARLDLDSDRAWLAAVLCLCWPASLALFTPYTESLFLLLSCLTLLCARQKRFWLAGLCGALAALTRQTGIFLFIPLAWELWKAKSTQWFSALLIPAGYAVWIGYRMVIGDFRPEFTSPQRFIYSVMISPSSYQILTEQQFTPMAIFKAVSVLIRGAHWSAYGDVALGFLFVALSIFSFRRLRTSYALYCAAIVTVSLCHYTGSVIPYMALPRHLLPAFPIFIGLCARYEFRRPYLVAGYLAFIQMLFLCGFVWESWVL